MIKIEKLQHIYPQGLSLNFPDWEIGGMEQWLLLGASGSGKSTLLNHISGLLKPSKGKIFIGDIDIYSFGNKKMDKFRGQHIGIVFQRPHLIRSLTVLENLEIAASMASVSLDEERNLSLLAELGLESKVNNYPEQLSQGQLQRVSVARALVNRPDLLIADEPTSNLDDENAKRVLEMLSKQALNHGAALIIATHDNRVRSKISKTYTL